MDKGKKEYLEMLKEAVREMNDNTPQDLPESCRDLIAYLEEWYNFVKQFPVEKGSKAEQIKEKRLEKISATIKEIKKEPKH